MNRFLERWESLHSANQYKCVPNIVKKKSRECIHKILDTINWIRKEQLPPGEIKFFFNFKNDYGLFFNNYWWVLEELMDDLVKKQLIHTYEQRGCNILIIAPFIETIL